MTCNPKIVTDGHEITVHIKTIDLKRRKQITANGWQTENREGTKEGDGDQGAAWRRIAE
ncbi:predicted protein [Plenodomus lingam JN3]|uniref:Predicted protein n=1 Tax=Leptosphaeria maculans (strain JN3 / isolate v23.1.3 / race Av1-4-5-6-7-8) TaxID=985895 RepID=E4ZVM7_LEPMJ|nr:predicted protein [Plenodomus lingam JN3]CBX95653.1 predicted protein [Plenodomus lingam JN3]